MSSRLNVLVTKPQIHETALKILSEKCNIIFCEEAPATRGEILRKVKNIDAICWDSKYNLDQQIVDAAGANLKVVSTTSAGYNNVDVDLLRSKGVPFGNTSDALKDCVAEVAIALTLTAAHRIHEGYKKIIKGEWESNRLQSFLGQELRNSTIGIVGLGHIGVEIALRMKSFKIKELLYTGHSEKPQGKELGAKFVSLDAIVKKSDFIIIACSLNESTRNLFGKKQFNEMKSSAIIVNISRGGVINQEDLVNALQNQTIGGAALDVMTPEPLPADHPLTKLDNCVICPHIGSATQRTRNDMEILAAQNILSVLEGKPMPCPVV